MIIRYNLQFFAEGQGGEKTEPATEKKLSDAREEGQVAKSREIANCLGLLSLFLVLKFWIGTMGTEFLQLFSGVYLKIPETIKMYGGQVPERELLDALQYGIIRMAVMVAPIFLIGFLVAFLSDYIQVKWKITAKPLKPKFNKLSPASGVKRIFSINSIVELIKSVAKIGLVLYVAYSYLNGKKNDIYYLYSMPLMQAVQLTGELVIDLGLRIAIVYLIIALLDFSYQKYKFAKDMRMSKQEIKEEYKQQEGDPQIKGKIRQRMREASQRRMMQDLPKADVVITNPTHYAVAIKYDPEQYEAPIVLAKGEDYLAQKIKEAAKENHIEIVENKPLARMLYANVEVGQLVPPELYQAVAEVLAFVYHLQGRTQ